MANSLLHLYCRQRFNVELLTPINGDLRLCGAESPFKSLWKPFAINEYSNFQPFGGIGAITHSNAM